ncbi:MAG: hypothetical protein KBC46_03280 [Ferrovibrio sp.]|nr:hypothetical protein [Ferrovibrio sp.]
MSRFRPYDRVRDPVSGAYGTVVNASPAGFTNQFLTVALDATPDSDWFIPAHEIEPAPVLTPPGHLRLVFSQSPAPPWAASPGRSTACPPSQVSPDHDGGPRPAA